MIIEAIREYFIKCPYLSELSPVNVDYLGENVGEYTIDGLPTATTLKEYVDGAKLKSFDFTIGSRNSFGPDFIEQIENRKTYSKIESWIDDNNKNGIYPFLGEDKIPVRIDITTSGYLFASDVDTARYQIQAKLLYFEEY